MYTEDLLGHNWLGMRAVNEKVRARAPFLNGEVLDLGCGTRPFESDIARYSTRYVGVDWSNTLHALKADIVANLNEPLPVPDASFDHVVSFEVLEHLAEPDVMLGEACRILRSGGEITLSVPFQWWVHEAPWDYYRYTRYGLEYKLKKAGFINVQVEPTTGFWSMWILKLNYRLARRVRGSWLRRNTMRLLLVPFWFLSQHAAAWLDRRSPDERESAGYFVTARKP